MRHYSTAYSLALVLVGVCVSVFAQSQKRTAEEHLAAAKAAAGYEVSDLYDHLCSRLLVGSNLPYGRIPRPANHRDPMVFHEEPVKVFDNLVYLGEKMVHGASPSSWGVITSEGIILIDALFDNSVEDEIVGGLRKLNLDPADIKYVIVTHTHGDHIGGAKYLQDHFGTRVVSSAQDWDVLEQNQNFNQPKPRRDMDVVDGQKLTLGDTTITCYITPGHTPGALSLLVPLKDGGKQHLAAIWGGTGMQWSAQEYHNSAVRFRDIVDKSGADVLLSTHPQLDKSDIKLRLVEKRKPGAPHPFVIGNDLVKAYLTVAAECSAAALLLPEEYRGYLGRP